MADRVKLTELEQGLLIRCANGVDIKSSDRESDRARTKLKRLGLLAFERSNWHWSITETGRALLASNAKGD